jgi:Cytochrome c7 and related cytochrome c
VSESDVPDDVAKVAKVTPQALSGPELPIWLLKRYWILVMIAGCVAIAFFSWFLSAFDDKGYAPLQPIAFSHKLHAGEMNINCAYCHFNAEHGKHAGVPPMSVCLGCHSPDKGAVAPKSSEIAKLLSIVDKGSYTDADGVIREGGVVHWNRVHKLPDHVYFSHEWHVKAAVACQTCHGEVESMAVVRQHATLTMGWCLDCHRKSNYVGGPNYNGHAETFAVGTANYDVVRHDMRTPKDPIITFKEREVKTSAAETAKPSHEAGRQPVVEHEPAAIPRASKDPEFIKQLQAHPNLPRWRVADLPETHRAAYKDLYQKDGNGELIVDLSKTLMNAPTQCNTCHQ